MGKRTTDTLRSPSEIRQDAEKYYGKYISQAKKLPSRINPVFTEKPHYGLEVGKK